MANRKEARDETKLPAWAQRELVRLRSSVDYHKSRADAVCGDLPSDTVIVEGMGTKNLPPGAMVRFLFGTEVGEWINVRLNEGVLEIATGESPLIVLPRYSNTIHLLLGKRS